MLAPRRELDAGPDHEVLDGRGDQDLAGSGEGADSRRDVDGQAGEIIAADLALARVQTCSQFDPERPDGSRDCLGAADRSRGTIEAGDEAVAGRVDLRSPKPSELVTHGLVMRVEERAPTPVAQ